MGIIFKGSDVAKYVGAVCEVRRYFQLGTTQSYAIVWDGNEAVEIEGSEYTCVIVDATPVVREAYAEWTAKQDRAVEVARKCVARKQMSDLAKELGVANRFAVERLKNAFMDSNWGVVEKLLRTKKFRSQFRASIASQLRVWAETKVPQYRTPLSKKQQEAIGIYQN